MTCRLPACSHYCGHLKDQPVARERSNLKGRAKGLLARGDTGSLRYRLAERLYRSLHLSTLFHDRYYSNNTLGVFFTTVCNLSCHNCQTSAKQALSTDMLTVDQLEGVVDEAVSLEYFWDRIVITGGEATVHPQFFELLCSLDRYRSFHPACRFVLETNGAGDRVQSVLNEVPDWVVVSNSSKAKGNQSYAFATYNVAPVDLPAYRFSDFSKGCSRVSTTHGLCATMYGYYPCSPCMNVARVFGFDVGIQTLSMVTESALREQMKVLCRYCGWFKERRDEVVWTEKTSRSWKRAFADYRKQEPELSRYNL